MRQERLICLSQDPKASAGQLNKPSGGILQVETFFALH